MTNSNTQYSSQAISKFPSLQELNSLFPRHLAMINTLRSLKSLWWSVFFVVTSTVVGYAFLIFHDLPSWISGSILFAYSFVIGTCLVGFWILAHECGHGTFLKPKWLEDSIGLVLHTICLIPYFAWARSHLLHHASHGHIQKDTAYLPVLQGSLRSQVLYNLPRRILGQSISRFIHVTAFTLLGWPLYLLAGITGGRFVGLNHFFPMLKKGFDPFPGWQLKVKVLGNTVIYGLWVYGIIRLLASDYSIAVFWLYLLPLLWVNVWLVVYTFLHHTGDDSYWLDQKSWSFSEGAFTAIDRPYWKITNFLHHNIGRYHVYHHLNSKIPHYHGEEATRLIQQKYPDFYQVDKTRPCRALWQTMGRAGVVYKDDAGRYRYT